MKRAGALLLLVACGTGSVATPVNENSGAETKRRLRAHVWKADDVELLRWFYDSKRKEDCAFVENGIANTGPGPTYWCLPRNSARHDATGGLALFADKACTVPLALANAEVPANYVIVRGANTCVEPLRVFRAEAAQNGKPFIFDGTKCAQATASVAVQGLGEEIPLESFVSASETVTPVTGPIARLELVASDGSRQTIGGFDPARGLAVAVGNPGAKSEERWYPARLAFEGAGTKLFSDDACKEMVSTKVARDAICPLGASFVFEGTCGDGAYYALGEAVDATALHEINPVKRCVPSSGKGVIAYTKGPLMEQAAFAKAGHVDRGAGRIRLRSRGVDQSEVMPTDFVDSQLEGGEICTPEATADGQTRCLPGGSASVTLWADAACTALAYEVPDDGCNTKTIPRYVRSSGHAYRVKGNATQTYERTAKGCSLHKAVVESHAYAVEEINVAQFAVLTEVTK